MQEQVGAQGVMVIFLAVFGSLVYEMNIIKVHDACSSQKTAMHLQME